ncbi:MAG TPA: DUF2075 domain-containing protein [Steroidobacteraceae bacterium]|nr:DUF2075 domain-containing protein [Steroidobacteraceae bacterium]
MILWRGFVFVVEYKVGARDHSASALDQTLGYALDLKHFHETSHDRPIVPVLVATDAEPEPVTVTWGAEEVAQPIRATPDTLAEIMRTCASVSRPEINAESWEQGRYRPTPTIIQAAQALYNGHSVEEISRSEAGAENLTATASYIESVIETAKRNRRKVICFVTGVPGSGKTLAGLNLATRRMRGHDEEHAVFLSGNGPLVKVLRSALAGDALDRNPSGVRTTRAQEMVKASAFIQNIHHFRDEALETAGPLTGKVVIFDEAQRAWDLEQTAKFMREKRGKQAFSQSEPEFLLSVMDRNQDWCVVVCLVGGGQEINTGEAGLTAWLEALSRRFPSWDVHFASQLLGSEYGPDGAASSGAVERAARSPHLHLSVSVRSYRAEKVSEFVAAVLDGEPDKARAIYQHLPRYPIGIVRDLSQARDWVRMRRRGPERGGLLSSSNALRLKPDGIFVRAKIDPEDWFLAPHGDVRGSDALEDVGTEFDVQGLELDWACVCWDANWRWTGAAWEAFKFSGSSWKKVRDPGRRAFLMNSYRVLMTRARQGFVVFVPRGDIRDATRSPEIYDRIAGYLARCGIEQPVPATASLAPMATFRR